MHFLAVASVDRIRLSLVTITGIRALVVNLHHHTGTHGKPVRGEPVTLGRDVPALTTAFPDAGHYAGGATVDLVAAKVVAAGVCEVVGGGETCAARLRVWCQYCETKIQVELERSLQDLMSQECYKVSGKIPEREIGTLEYVLCVNLGVSIAYLR